MTRMWPAACLRVQSIQKVKLGLGAKTANFVADFRRQTTWAVISSWTGLLAAVTHVGQRQDKAGH